MDDELIAHMVCFVLGLLCGALLAMHVYAPNEFRVGDDSNPSPLEVWNSAAKGFGK